MQGRAAQCPRPLSEGALWQPKPRHFRLQVVPAWPPAFQGNPGMESGRRAPPSKQQALRLLVDNAARRAADLTDVDLLRHFP